MLDSTVRPFGARSVTYSDRTRPSFPHLVSPLLRITGCVGVCSPSSSRGTPGGGQTPFSTDGRRGPDGSTTWTRYVGPCDEYTILRTSDPRSPVTTIPLRRRVIRKPRNGSPGHDRTKYRFVHIINFSYCINICHMLHHNHVDRDESTPTPSRDPIN